MKRRKAILLVLNVIVLISYLGFLIVSYFLLEVINQLPVKPMTFWEYVAGIISLAALRSINKKSDVLKH